MKKIYLLSLLSIFSLNLFCQINWTKHPDNPVVVPGSAGEWDEDDIGPGSVIYYDTTYHMWYTGGVYDDTSRIGHATSPDGITWTKDTNNPVLDVGLPGDWDENTIFAGGVLVIDSIFHMWYTGHTGLVWNQNYRIGHATSPDGVTWTKDTNNPVLEAGSMGDWDQIFVAAGPVIYDGSEYHMWYGGWNGSDDYLRIGHASSPDAVTWTKDTNNPVITSEAGNWDYPRLVVGSVVFDGTTYHMWYAGGIYQSLRIGYATSEDGSSWTKHANNPVLNKGPAGSWDEREVVFCTVIDSAGVKYKMWYGGSKTAQTGSIGYAESQIPAWKLIGSHRGGPSCVLDSIIYVFNSEGQGWTISPSAHSYNTVTNEWSELTPMPVAITEGSVGLIGDKIYLVGGWWNDTPNNWATVDSILEYDISLDSWTFKKRCPEPTASNAFCVLNDTMYILGGMESLNPTDVSKAWTYDPFTEVWDTISLPDMLYPHQMHGTAEVLNGDIYMIGGTGLAPDFYPMQSEKFDGEKWESIAEMPVPVVEHASIVHDNKILVFGGDSIWSISESFSTNFVQEYDPSTNTWRLMEPMPFQRADMVGEKVGNYVYLIGGYTNDRVPSTYVSEVWRLDLRSLKPFTYATGVSLDKDTLSLIDGSIEILVATVYPDDASDKSVTWTSADAAVATVANGTVTGVAGGETYIYVTTNDGNFKDSCFVTVIPTGINKAEATGFKLYPNPASDLITLEFNSQETHTVEITSLNGQLLYNSRMEGPTHQIDLSSFQKGLYFITVRSRNYVRTEKIVKL